MGSILAVVLTVFGCTAPDNKTAPPPAQQTTDTGTACATPPCTTTTLHTGDTGTTISWDDLVGKTYQVTWTDGDVVSPEDYGLLLSLVDPTSVLYSVTAVTDDTLTVLVAPVNDSGQQDRCAPTKGPLDFDWTNAPRATHEEIPGSLYTTSDLSFEPMNAERVERIAEVSADLTTLNAVLDAKDAHINFLSDLVGGPPCPLLETFGISCHICIDGSDDCLDLRIEDIPGVELPGATVVQRSEADIAADPGC